MSTIRIQVAPRVGPDNPRGARVGAAVFIAVWKLVAALAALFKSKPDTPEQDARQVRELAARHMQTDPRFAADLVAAADRHETLHSR